MITQIKKRRLHRLLSSNKKICVIGFKNLCNHFFIFFLVMSVYAFAEQERFSEVIVKPNVEYKAEDLRDPFQSPFVPREAPVPGPGVLAAPEAPPSLEIQGIIWGGDFPQAIINNKVVKIGDTIEGVEIMDINQSGVVVVSGDYTYNLPSPAQKQEKERQGGEK